MGDGGTVGAGAERRERRGASCGEGSKGGQLAAKRKKRAGASPGRVEVDFGLRLLAEST